MDFNLNDEQELFVAGIRELMASENWEAYFAECDRDSVYPERFVKALADMGIDSLLIPEEHGGLEAGVGVCYNNILFENRFNVKRQNISYEYQ